MVSEHIEAPNTGDNNWYLEAFLYGVWQGTANNLAAFNSSLAVKYTEDLRDEWDEIYHGSVYDKEAGEIDFSKEDLSLLKKARLSDEDIDTITAQEIDDKKLEDEITIPGATYDVSEKYYDLTRYVNDVNTENIEVLQEYTQSGSLKSSHVYGNERIYSDVYDPASDAFNVSTYNYDGRRSVAQTSTGNDITGQLSYDPFGNLISGAPVSASIYGYNAEESNTLTGLQYLRARYYDTGGGRFITADDYLGDVKQPLTTLNRYAYTANNPVKYNDPNGHLFGWIKNGAKNVGNAFKKVGSAIATGAKKVVGGVRKVASTVKNGIKKAYTSVKNFAKKAVGVVKKAYNNMKNTFSGGNNRAMSGKQKKSNYTQNVNKPIMETFVNMMGVGVQLAVGSSQIKRHLDAVKKKIVEYHCGDAETIKIQKNEKNNIASKYKYKYCNDINGIGMMNDGTILYGRNATVDDANLLIILKEMSEKNYTKIDMDYVINKYIENNERTVIEKEKGIDYYTNTIDITNDLMKEMIRNEYENATQMTRKDLTTPYDAIAFLFEFKQTVQNKGKWDLKQKEEWNKSSLYYFDGKIVDIDAPGNIMYGYLGKAYGFSDKMLYMGAGYAQIDDGTAMLEFCNTYFDDPIDQNNISIGIEVYNKTHKKRR